METYTQEVITGTIIIFALASIYAYNQYKKARSMAREDPIVKTFSKLEKAIYNPEMLEIENCTILNRNGVGYDIRLEETNELIRNVDRNLLHKIF